MDFLSIGRGRILLEHSRPVAFLLHKLQAVLAGGTLRATGFLALFYTTVLFTEGIGVYLQQRWAELLMIFATGALIPIEVRHILAPPRLGGRAHLAGELFHRLVPPIACSSATKRTPTLATTRIGRDSLGRFRAASDSDFRFQSSGTFGANPRLIEPRANKSGSCPTSLCPNNSCTVRMW